jgi:hypothetical protein
VTPVIATVAAALWHGVAKPLGNLLRRCFPSRSAQPPVRAQAVRSSLSSPSPSPQLNLSASVTPVTANTNANTNANANTGRPTVSPLVLSQSTVSLTNTQPKPAFLSSVASSSSSSGVGEEEQKQRGLAEPVDLTLYQPGRSSALVLKAQEVDLSYMYDGLTVYPKSTGEITGLAECIRKCEELEFLRRSHPLGFLLPDSPRATQRTKKASTCMMQIKAQNGDASFQRHIHRDDDDHDLYHQDAFPIDRNHYHLKFNRLISMDQFSQMIYIFAAESLITATQASDYIRAFKGRNLAARAALDAALASLSPGASDGSALASMTPSDKKRVEKEAILKFISTCRNNDLLVDLHRYLSEAKFDHLREITEMHPSKEWQGTNRSGNVVKTSQAWAQIEKGISLQMIKNIREQARSFTQDLGKERSMQLATSHAFFGIKRTQPLSGSHVPRTNKTIRAFSTADRATLDRKYNKIFRP